jgi:hypothetical protein
MNECRRLLSANQDNKLLLLLLSLSLSLSLTLPPNQSQRVPPLLLQQQHSRSGKKKFRNHLFSNGNQAIDQPGAAAGGTGAGHAGSRR